MFGQINHRKDLIKDLRHNLANAARELAKQKANLIRAELEVIGCTEQIAYGEARLAATRAALDKLDKEDSERKASEKAEKDNARVGHGDHGAYAKSGPEIRLDPQREGWGHGASGHPLGAS